MFTRASSLRHIRLLRSQVTVDRSRLDEKSSRSREEYSMRGDFALRKRQLGLAVATALSATVAAVPATAGADEFGTYVTGDFHNHSTCSDGSISMQKLVSKSTNDE